MADLGDPTFWIPTAISIVAVLLFYLDMRWRIKREEKTSVEMAQMIRVLKQELELFRKQAEGGHLTSQELQKQKALQSQSDTIWKGVMNALKAAKLVKEVFGDET